MLYIFAKADISNVNSTFHTRIFGCSDATFSHVIAEKVKPIRAALSLLHYKGNIVMTTPFVEKNVPMMGITGSDGKVRQIKVVDLSVPLNDEIFSKSELASIFPTVEKTRDIRFFGTVVGNYSRTTMFLENPLLLDISCVSLLSPEANTTFDGGNSGLVLESPPAGIVVSSPFNLSSGYEKNEERLLQIQFGDKNDTAARKYRCAYSYINHFGKLVDVDRRHFVRNLFIDKLKKLGYSLTRREYALLHSYVSLLKSTKQIHDFEIDGKIIKAADIVVAIEYSQNELFKGCVASTHTSTHNETVLYRATPRAGFVKLSEEELTEFRESATLSNVDTALLDYLEETGSCLFIIKENNRIFENVNID